MNIWRKVMTKEFEDRGTTYSIHENVNIGEVKVADEVVAILVGHSCVQGCEDRLLERRFIQCG